MGDHANNISLRRSLALARSLTLSLSPGDPLSSLLSAPMKFRCIVRNAFKEK